MRSPFPGMDPYIEPCWGPVHLRLIVNLCDQLNETLPRDLCARIEERIYLESPPDEPRFRVPDVMVLERPEGRLGRPARGGVAAAGYLVVDLEVEPVKDRFIQIIEAGSGGKIVTSIEVVSPSNKRPGKGRKLYLREQRELAKGGVSSVEIDLHRSGMRVLPVAPERLPASKRTPYLACVRRGHRPLRAEVYPIPLREPLPALAIPLREGEDDEVLVVQSALDESYIKGRFDERIDYRIPPSPPLEPDDEEWADALLRGAGRR